jgi:hypothetical protein
MFKNRLFNLFIAISLVIVIALTVQEARATAAVITSSTKGAKTVACESLPSRYSLQTKNVKEAELWVVYTEDGPAGIDGGLIYLLSNYRTCSR